VTLLTDFKKFLLRGNVVDLAVGVVSASHSEHWSRRSCATCSHRSSR
jgi:hypothetical protein